MWELIKAFVYAAKAIYRYNKAMAELHAELDRLREDELMFEHQAAIARAKQLQELGLKMGMR